MGEASTIAMTLQTLLSNVTTVLQSMLGWVIDIFNTATSSPIVLVFIVMALIGVVIAFAKSLLHM